MKAAVAIVIAAALWLPAAAGAATPPGVLAQLGSPFGCTLDQDVPPLAACINGARGLGVPNSMALSPDGLNAYVTGVNGNTVAVFDRDFSTGALFQKDGKAGCIVDEPSPNIAGCTNTGRGLDQPIDVAVSPDGAHVYVTASTSSSIAVFDRDPFTGVITQKSGTDGCLVSTPAPDIPGCDNTGTALDGATGLALDGFGTTLYVASRQADAIAIIDRDTA